LRAAEQQNSDVEVFKMDVHAVATALSSHFIGFKGSETELLRELFAHSDPGSLRDCPSNPRAFRTALRVIAPELLVLGVSVTIFDTGMCHITSATAAQKEASDDAHQRSSFFSALPEAVALRKEFGDDENGYRRFAAYRRGLNAGQIKPPLRGTNAIAGEDKAVHASVDSNLPLEEQLAARWQREPSTRAAFTSFEAFSAFERASARGVVRKLQPRA
jgi:hypothetical protein